MLITDSSSTDTLQTEVTAPVVDTPSSETPTTSTVLTEEQEILQDLGRLPAEEKPKEETPEDKPEGEDDPDANADGSEKTPEQRMRDDYLKKASALADRERELADREKALAEKEQALTGKPADDQRTTDASKPDASAETGDDILSRWAAVKAEIEKDWTEYDSGIPDAPLGYEAPGERRLVAILDAVIPEIAEIRQFLGMVQEQTVQAEGVHVAGVLQEAAKRATETYGEAVDPVALAGILQNGGVEAYAKLKGVPVESLQISPDLFLEIYEMANAAKLRSIAGKKPTTEEEPKKPLPDLNRGGGTRVPEEPATEEDEIIRDLRASATSRTIR